MAEQRLADGGVHDRAAAEGDDSARPHEFDGRALLEATEVRLALIREDLCDGLARLLLDGGVDVHEAHAEPAREALAHRRLPGPRRADEDDAHRPTARPRAATSAR